MYLPFIKVTAQEDKIGNLKIWLGENTPQPTDDSKIAYIQTSQDRSSIFVNCFGLEEECIEDLQKGYTIVLYLHVDYITDIFC